MRHRPIDSSAASPVRGFVLILAGALALFRSFTLHETRNALLAAGLGIVALLLGLWHLTRKSGRPRG